MTRFQQEMRWAREHLEAAKTRVMEQSLVWDEDPEYQRLMMSHRIAELLSAAATLETTRTKQRPLGEYFE